MTALSCAVPGEQGAKPALAGQQGCAAGGDFFFLSTSAHFIQTRSLLREFTFLFIIRTNKLHCLTKSLLILSKCKSEVCLGFFRRQQPVNKDVTSHAWSLFCTELGGTKIQSKKMKTILNFFANKSLHDTVQRRKVEEVHGRSKIFKPHKSH